MRMPKQTDLSAVRRIAIRDALALHGALRRNAIGAQESRSPGWVVIPVADLSNPSQQGVSVEPEPENTSGAGDLDTHRLRHAHQRRNCERSREPHGRRAEDGWWLPIPFGTSGTRARLDNKLCR